MPSNSSSNTKWQLQSTETVLSLTMSPSILGPLILGLMTLVLSSQGEKPPCIPSLEIHLVLLLTALSD
jgi:hypothetical protein